MKKIIFTAIMMGFFSIANLLHAQDIHFSQLKMVPLLIDPSLAGNTGCDVQAILNYRNQWGRFTQYSYKTFGGSVEMAYKEKAANNFLGFGISVYSDKAGEIELTNTKIDLAIAYHVMLNENSYLSGGIEGGVLQKNFDIAAIETASQFDGSGFNQSLPSNELYQDVNFIRPDLSAGVSYYFNTNRSSSVAGYTYNGTMINAGLVGHHLPSANISFTNLAEDTYFYRYVFHFNSSFGGESSNLSVQPSVYTMFQEGANNIVVGSFFRYTLKERSKYTGYLNGAAVSIGAHYRIGDAIIPGFLLELGSWALGLSYDVIGSDLTAYSANGGLELSIKYVSPNPFTGKKNARFF